MTPNPRSRPGQRRTGLLVTAVLSLLALTLVAAGCSGGYGTATTAVPSSGTAPGTSDGGAAQVTMQNFAFNPATITIKAGDTVTWTNQDGVDHNATAADGSWATDTFGNGGSGSVTFDKPGTYTYICTIHPNMKGTVVVE